MFEKIKGYNETDEKAADLFWGLHKGFAEEVRRIYEDNYIKISLGDMRFEEVEAEAEALAEEEDLYDFKREYIKYLQ